MIGQSANGIGKDSSGMMIRIKTKEVIDFLSLDAERKTKERIYPPKSDD